MSGSMRQIYLSVESYVAGGPLESEFRDHFVLNSAEEQKTFIDALRRLRAEFTTAAFKVNSQRSFRRRVIVKIRHPDDGSVTRQYEADFLQFMQTSYSEVVSAILEKDDGSVICENISDISFIK